MAKDKYHDLVRTALEREGWTITDDPLILADYPLRFEVDLGAERLLAAEKGNNKIAVEIKSFLNVSLLYDFYQALGQFTMYSLALQKLEPDRQLYLAVPSTAYESIFQQQLIEGAVKKSEMKLIVYSIQKETIKAWIR